MSPVTQLCPGSGPKMAFRTTGDNDLLLYYKTLKNGGVYGKTSTDGGVTWRSNGAFITNQAANTKSLEIVRYDATHVSVAQLGSDVRALREVSLFSRTRPLRSIQPHPSTAGTYFVGEPSKFDNVTLTDNLRGALVPAQDGLSLYHLDGVAQGTSDSVGAVAKMTVTGTTIALPASAGPTGGVAGHNLVQYTLVPAISTLNVALTGATSYAVDAAVSSTYAYVAEYSDSTTAGQLAVVNLSTGTVTTPLTGITAVRAVAVSMFTSVVTIYVATTESGVERLRVYQENGGTPTLLLNVKLPARVNNLTVVPGPGGSVAAQILVSTTTSFGIYNYYGSGFPIRLIDSYTFSSSGSFFRSTLAASGNIVVAAGQAGVIVFSSSGKLLAQAKTSGKVVAPWVPQTAYSLNALVTARSVHPFAPNNYYFKATTGGTSGKSEPAWDTTGTMSDATVVWTPQASCDSYVTDVAVDSTASQIYAVGSVGGPLGTDGRIWIMKAAPGLL